MTATLRKPTDRVCELCGRHERWDDEDAVWRVARDEDGTPETGAVFCIHEWDINGTFVPIVDEADAAEA